MKNNSGQNAWAFREQFLTLSPNGVMCFNEVDTIHKNGVPFVKSNFSRIKNADDVFTPSNLARDVLSIEYKLSDAFLGWIKVPQFDYLRFKAPLLMLVMPQ